MDRSKKDRMVGMLGLGMESEDGHIRISKGDHFKIVMGSEEAHEAMLKLCIEINKALEQEGRTLEELSREEFIELLGRIT